MKLITAQTQSAWLSAWKGGSDRPMQRATIQRMNICQFPYDLSKSAYGLKGQGVYTSAIFGQADQPIELPNIKSINWERSTREGVSTCTLVLYNCEVLPLGGTPENAGNQDFELPGYFTFNHGATATSKTRWNQVPNGWQDILLPDRIIRTYEGYGFDIAETPENDPYQYPSGVWIIDDVEYGADATITVTCRDIGRILLDQMVFPPVIPWNQYPLTFTSHHNVANPKVPASSTGWSRPSYDTDSNIPYIGRGFTDGGMPYVSSSGAVLGHHGKHAFDNSQKTYWLSVGDYPNWSSAYEFVQGTFSSRLLRAVKVYSWGGPYTYYISVYANGKWQGRSKIPYRARAVDTNADIRFVKTGKIGKDQELIIDLPKDIPNATIVRITFSDLFNTGIGRYRWRAGIRDVQISSTVTNYVDGGTHVEGNYGDYTDVVKMFCAWGGFFWPNQSTGLDFITDEDGTQIPRHHPSGDDPALASDFVWGALEQTGTQGKVDLTADIFDKKFLMDGISYVRDIVNFLFAIDEYGGVIWRSPNIWSVGNYVMPTGGGPNVTRTTDLYEIDEVETLMGLTAKVSSRNVREKIFVANVNGKFGAMSEGFNPADSGIRRIAMWTDQNFQSEQECQIMADLIAVREMFTYRQNQVEIPGNPGIQIDDQIRIFERVTGETYIHYVDAISSQFDMSTGRWTYTITTHWLGEEPFDKWAFDPAQLAPETQAYLRLIGKI